jgi:hypothetical protein
LAGLLVLLVLLTLVILVLIVTHGSIPFIESGTNGWRGPSFP